MAAASACSWITCSGCPTRGRRPIRLTASVWLDCWKAAARWSTPSRSTTNYGMRPTAPGTGRCGREPGPPWSWHTCWGCAWPSRSAGTGFSSGPRPLWKQPGGAIPDPGRRGSCWPRSWSTGATIEAPPSRWSRLPLRLSKRAAHAAPARSAGWSTCASVTPGLRASEPLRLPSLALEVVGPVGREIRLGVDGAVVEAHLEVHMRPTGGAGGAPQADRLSLLGLVAGLHEVTLEVAVKGHQPVVVGNDHVAPVADEMAGEHR